MSSSELLQRTQAYELYIAHLSDRLWRSGSVYPVEETQELINAARGDLDALGEMAKRRIDGMPLAWVIGSTMFSDVRVLIQRGVYIPRQQTEALAERAVLLLKKYSIAVDLCTGSGAIAMVLKKHRPFARIVATDIDPIACSCARSNGVDVYEGSLDTPLPGELFGIVDLVTAVVPYVPHYELALLPNDIRSNEPIQALDGGNTGIDVLVQAIEAASRLLKKKGYLLLELGGKEDTLIAPYLEHYGFSESHSYSDEEGALRMVAVVKS